MIENFKTISSTKGHVFAISHDASIIVSCQENESLVHNLRNNSQSSFHSTAKISAAIIISLNADHSLVYYVILATVDGNVQVLSDGGKLLFQQFVQANISFLKVNYAQDFIYALAGNVIITLKLSYSGSLSIWEKINLLGQSVKDVLMLGSEYREFLSPITINQNGQILYSKYDNVIVGVGKMISFYGKMDKREGSWTGQLEGSLGAVFSMAKTLWKANDAIVNSMPMLELNPLISLQDDPRIINRIILSPPHPLTGKSSFAALTDNLGRLLVLDLGTGEVIRLYKGMRDVQAGWILKKVETPAIRYILLLVAYCPRGTLEVFTMKYQSRLIGIEVERNLILVSSAHAVFGGLQLRINQVDSNPTSSDCFLVASNGQIKKIMIDSELIIKNYVNPFWLSDIQNLLLKYAEEPSLFCLKIGDIVQDLSIFDLEQVIKRSQPVLSLDDYLRLLELCVCTVGKRNNSPKGSVLPDHKLAFLGSDLLSIRSFKYLSNPPIAARNEIQNDITQLFFEQCKFSQKSMASGIDTIQMREYTWRDYLSCFESSASTSYLKVRKRNRNVDLSSFLIPKMMNFWPTFDHVFDILGIIEEDWIALIVVYVSEYESFLMENEPILAKLIDYILFVIKKVLDGAQYLCLRKLLDFCQSTKSIGSALLISFVINYHLKSKPIEEFHISTNWANSLERLRMCSLFSYALDNKQYIELGITAKSFGEQESLCVSRLLALSRIQSYNQPADSDVFKLDIEKWLASDFGYEINLELVQIYMAYELGRYWVDLKDKDWLQRCVATTGIIDSINLRNALSITIFMQFMATKLENIFRVIEKARKIPSDSIMSRTCGLEVKDIPFFLDNCLTLLEFICADEYSTSRFMMQAIEDAVKISEKKSHLMNLSYYDNALGVIIEYINPSKSESQISGSILLNHISMIKVLQFIFKYNLKNVRPLRLFDSNLHFCASLLASINPSPTRMDSIGKIEKERELFLDKLLEADPLLVRNGVISNISW